MPRFITFRDQNLDRGGVRALGALRILQMLQNQHVYITKYE